MSVDAKDGVLFICGRCDGKGVHTAHEDARVFVNCVVCGGSGRINPRTVPAGETRTVGAGTPAAVAGTPGVKHDGGKPRWDLLPLSAVEPIVVVLTFGAIKYAPGNWMTLDDAVERYYAAMMRHLAAWRGGERYDPESGLHHLAHAGCCMIFLLWFETRGGYRA